MDEKYVHTLVMWQIRSTDQITGVLFDFAIQLVQQDQKISDDHNFPSLKRKL